MSSPRRKWILKVGFVLCAAYLIGCLAGGVLLAELQSRPPRRFLHHGYQMRQLAREEYHADLQDVAVTVADGTVLRGWYLQPEHDNGNVVILLHGVGDNREGVSGFARIFLPLGYRVLLPDSRAHGVSGGDRATFGVREADDVHRWVNWLYKQNPKCVYGFAESMGAAILLQSLNKEPRFCAVVVESAFSTFPSVAYERSARYLGLPTWTGNTVLHPVVDVALLYSRWKYGIDFRQANPADAVATTQVPMLLIAGTKDEDILPHHSVDLAKLNLQKAELWMVNGAAHGGAWGVDPPEFERRVTEFFRQHD